MTASSVVVIGAGVAGASSALHLAEAGVGKITAPPRAHRPPGIVRVVAGRLLSTRYPISGATGGRATFVLLQLLDRVGKKTGFTSVRNGFLRLAHDHRH